MLPSPPNQRRQPPQLNQARNRPGVRQAVRAPAATNHRVLTGASVGAYVDPSHERSAVIGKSPVLISAGKGYRRCGSR